MLIPSLLIVPYGIETCSVKCLLRHIDFLLIVPYGIETLPTLRHYDLHSLLIVPYGIETLFDGCVKLFYFRF